MGRSARTLALVGAAGVGLALVLAAFFLGRGVAGDEQDGERDGVRPPPVGAHGSLAQAAQGRVAAQRTWLDFGSTSPPYRRR